MDQQNESKQTGASIPWSERERFEVDPTLWSLVVSLRLKNFITGRVKRKGENQRSDE
jgi:hypothetical protein